MATTNRRVTRQRREREHAAAGTAGPCDDERLNKTVLMITLITDDVDHGVDTHVDAVALLADRIGMLRNVPSAAIGEVLDADLQRPRMRLEHGGHPTDMEARAKVLPFRTRVIGHRCKPRSSTMAICSAAKATRHRRTVEVPVAGVRRSVRRVHWRSTLNPAPTTGGEFARHGRPQRSATRPSFIAIAS